MRNRLVAIFGMLACSMPAAAAQTTSGDTAGSVTGSDSTTTTATATVTRVEDLVCSEPVNSVATCGDPQGRIVSRVVDLTPTTTTVLPRPEGDQPPQSPRLAPRAAPSIGRQLALTG